MKPHLAVVFLAFALPAEAERLVVGEPIAVSVSSPRPYAVEAGAPRLVWSHTFQHPGASYIAPHFAWFDLAPGDHALVRSPDGKQAWRYEGLGRAGLGRSPEGFWASHVRGDTAIVELYASGPVGPANGLEVDSYARGFDDREIELANGIELPDAAAICGLDDSKWARCYETSEPAIYEASRAVARLLIQGQFACTGWLLGCEGHLMTNRHCITTTSDAQNTDFEFMAEGATCNVSCAGWGACPGTVEADSSVLVQTDAALDYALVRLPLDLSESYGYFKLRPEGPVLDERIWIPQHPAHWGKRIAVASTHTQDGSGFCEIHTLTAPGCSGAIPDVGYHCDTQGGSSGSPVVAYSDQRVVALHHCANCPNRGASITNIIADLGPTNLPDCALIDPTGELTVGQDVVSCSDALEVVVSDDSLARETALTVEAWSDTENAPEIVTLEARAPGVFAGVVLTVPAQEAAAGDGSVAVVHGDTLSVRYIDLDAGGVVPAAVEATATADCQAPHIDKVGAIDVSGNAATITWDTSEPADGTVLSAGIPSGAEHEAELAIAHRVRLSGLAECSVHSYSVGSSDAVGNAAVEGEAGQEYTFTTGKNVRPEQESDDTPLAIPDGSMTASTIVIDDDRAVLDVDVEVELNHSFTGDLVLRLRMPGGQTILLANQLGGSGDDYDGTIFDDEALSSIAFAAPPFVGRYRPLQPLSAADLPGAAGPWTLEVEDVQAGQTGVLESWRLVLTHPQQMCGAHVTVREAALVADRCAGGAGDTNGLWDGGERVHLAVEVYNDGSEPLSGVQGRLVALTPGVVALSDVLTFPDLPVGASASSQEPAVFDLPLDLACGMPLHFRLDLESVQGTLPGQPFDGTAGQVVSFSVPSFEEAFNFGLPSSWAVVDGGADGRTWFIDQASDPAACGNPDPVPPIVGRWAAVDSDCAGDATMDESLVAPAIDLSGSQRIFLSFDHWFDRYQNEIADVDVRSSLTGGAWVNVARFLAPTGNAERVTLDISAQSAEAPDAQVRFRYHGASFDWFWYVDNVTISRDIALGCSTQPCTAGIDTPAPVPDGSFGTSPLRVAAAAEPGDLVLEWDETCEAQATNLIYGDLLALPAFEVGGGVCDVTSPAVWQGIPEGDLWFLLVTASGEVESSWGAASDGGERHGWAASTTCGTVVKDASATCP